MDFIAAFDKIAHPVERNGRSAIGYEKNFHAANISQLREDESGSIIYRLGDAMSRARILLVEDNQDNQDLMRFLLERAGYEVLSVGNGLLGIETARREKPDVVVMDLSMPELDGWHAARMMRSDPELKNIPLMAVTAHTLPGDRRKALVAGFDMYISKPINIHMFDVTVAKMLHAAA